jgi:hypothetical protein
MGMNKGIKAGMKRTDEPARLSHRAGPRQVPREPEDEGVGCFEHPDGWYWTAPDGQQQFGPFDTLADARLDRERGSIEAVDEAEIEREANIGDALGEAAEDRHAEDPDRGV